MNEPFGVVWEHRDDAWRSTFPDNWMQGRSCFGGVTASSAIALARQATETTRPLRSFNVQLLRPTLPGETDGTSQVSRDGKNVRFVETRLAQSGEDVAIVNAVFATSRDSETSLAPAAPEFDAEPDELQALPFIENMTPQFVENVSMKWAMGTFPFSGGDHAEFGGYCRFHDPLDVETAVIALLDVWPCPSLSLYDRPLYASTVMWTAHISTLPTTDDQWFRFTYKTVAGSDGYHSVIGHLFDAHGTFIAWTEQLVALFD